MVHKEFALYLIPLLFVVYTLNGRRKYLDWKLLWNGNNILAIYVKLKETAVLAVINCNFMAYVQTHEYKYNLKETAVPLPQFPWGHSHAWVTKGPVRIVANTPATIEEQLLLRTHGRDRDLRWRQQSAAYVAQYSPCVLVVYLNSFSVHEARCSPHEQIFSDKVLALSI